MPTLNQLCKQGRSLKKKKKKNSGFNGFSSEKGFLSKIFMRTPKKPNSARRKLVKVKLRNNLKINVYVPGEGHNLQEYSTVLVRGGRVKDLPGIKYHLIRGKYDLSGLKKRKTSRSKYGTKKNIDKLICFLMFNGKKSISEKTVLHITKKFKILSKKDVYTILRLAFKNSSTVTHLTSIKKRKRKPIEIPFFLKKNYRRTYMSIKNIILSTRKQTNIKESLFYEILDIANNKGSIKKN